MVYELVTKKEYNIKNTQINHAREMGEELVANVMEILEDMGYDYYWGRNWNINVYKRILIFKVKIAKIYSNNEIRSMSERYDDEVRKLHTHINKELKKRVIQNV